MSTRKSKKKQLLVRIKEPCFIRKDTGSTNLTFMIGEYALPWKAITNVPPCDAVINEDKLKKLRKAFPDAHIEFNFNREAPAFLFKAIGRTKRCGDDKLDQSVGDAVARAKATARACVIAKAIIKTAISGLEEELQRNLKIFEEWHDKERNIVKGL